MAIVELVEECFLKTDQEVIILEIDESKMRLSLSRKLAVENPWEKFSKNHKIGQKLSSIKYLLSKHLQLYQF